MGCHTWFSVPIVTDKKEIIRLAQEYLDRDSVSLRPFISDGHMKMYQWAIDNEIDEVCCELATILTDYKVLGSWSLYQNIRYYSVDKYNRENGTKHDYYSHVFDVNPPIIETYSDEPRIGGYPDRIVRSYDDMVDFMKTGFVDDEGIQYDFRLDEDRAEKVMKDIKQFFINHPDGVITFG
jgi:hypothetical protein